jgi:hypothetical protein
MPNGFQLGSVALISLNNNGQVGGYGYDLNSHRIVPLVGSTAGLIPVPLGSDCANGCFGYRINDSGQIAVQGTAGVFIGSTSTGLTSIPVPAGFTGPNDWAVNNSGQLLGWATDGAIGQDFIGTAGGSALIPFISGWTSQSMGGINNLGQVAGTMYDGATTQAFIGTPAGSTPIPLPIGWTQVTVTDVNDSGQVVGIKPNGGDSAFIGTTAGSIPIPLPPGATAIYSPSINNLGVVIGSSNVGGWIWDPVDGIRLLNSSAPGWTVTSAIDINDLGQILAGASDSTGHFSTVLLTPIPAPEPAASSLIIIGLGFVAIRLRHTSLSK